MAKYSNSVTYDIKTTLDASGVTKLQAELAKVQSAINSLKGAKGLKLGLNINELEEYRNEIEQLSKVLSTTFNTRTGMLDLNKFNTALKDGTLNAGKLNAAFNAAGNSGKIAFNSLVTSITTLNKNAITANSTLSKIANTFGNTVRWGITASIVQGMMNDIQGAVSYMKDLDESLTQIQMVTNSSRENMRELAQYANQAAQALGSTTTDYTNAVKVFVQEGFSEKESKQYANLSTKLANVSEQNTQTTSDQITAYRNAFQLDYEQTVEAMDKVANVANNTASNVSELMAASQRSASVAQSVGASQESFLASIATIESVTRQGAEEIGNGLKAIYQRFADIKASGSTEDGVDYGQYAEALKTVGVDIVDATGNFKGMDQIFKELQETWANLSDTMKIAVGEKVAGKFQYNRFAALMNNPEYYQKAYNATQGASGMMDQMNDIYVESIEGRLNTLQAAGEQIMSTLFNQDDIEPVIEAATEFLNVINTIIDTVGGGMPVFTALSALILKTFNAQIGEQIARITTNISTMIQGSQNVKQMQAALIGLQANGIATDTDTYKYAKNSVGSMVGLSSNTQQEWSNTIAKSAEIEEQMFQAEKKYDEVVGLANSKLEARYKISSHIKDIEASKAELSKKEVAAYEQIRETLRQTVVLDEENFTIDQNLLRQKIAIAKMLASNKELSYQEVLQEAEKVDLLGTDLSITESILQAERERQAAQQQHNAQLQVQEQLDERMRIEQQGKSITNLISGLTSVIFLAQSAVSIWQTWADENTSLEDKIVNSLMSMAMILPMVVTAWQSLTAVKIADLQATAAHTVASLGNAAAHKLLTLAIAAESAGFKGLTEAIFGASVALEASPIGPVVIAIIALAAAIAGLVTLYDNWQNSIHGASKEFEAQQELLSKTKKNYSDAAEEIESLKKSLDDIGEAQTSLEGLTKGTDEWREAVSKLNDEILSLLETYPELAGKVNNNGGVLSIEKDELDKFYAQRLDETRHLQNMNMLQQANTLEAQNQKGIEDFHNQWGVRLFGDSLTKEEISDAISQGAAGIEGESAQLNVAFAELSKTVQSNNIAIDKLNGSIGTLTDYENYSVIKNNTDNEEIKKAILEEYGNSFAHNIDGTPVIDFSSALKDTGFLQEVSDALGQTVISAREDGWMAGGDLEFLLANGETEKRTAEEIYQLLALSRSAAETEEQVLQENIKVYKQFGVEWNPELRRFQDATGEAVDSLSELKTVTEEQSALLSKFSSDSNYKNFMSSLYGGPEGFAKFVSDNKFENDGQFADREAALDQFLNNKSFQEELEKYSETYNYPIETVEQFAEALDKGIIKVDGLADALDKLTPETVDLIHNINGQEFTNRVDISSDEDKMKEVLKDANVSEGAFSRMARDNYEDEGGYYQQEKQRLEELIEAKKSDGQVTEEERKEIIDLNSEIQGLNESSKDTTAMIINTADGVVDLRNKIQDISEILSNEALKGTVEWYQALTDLDEELSQVLNIDAGTLSDEFLESGDALAYAQRMAEGDMSAIDDLRRTASQDIIQNLNIQVTGEESIDELRAGLMAELNQLQADIDAGTITVATDLDTNPFTNKLDEMLAASQISEEQATQILSSVGMEANIKHKKEMGKVPQIEYRPTISASAIDVQGPDGQTMFSLPGIKMSPVVTEINAPIDIPYLEGTHYTGPGINTPSVSASNPSYTGGYSGNPKPSKSSSSKTNKSKNASPKDKKTSDWDYLTDITNDLDRASAAMEKLTKLGDRLYGTSRVKQLKLLQGEYKKYLKLKDQELNKEKAHLKILRTEAKDENGNVTINGYANAAGIKNLKFDRQGNLENGRAIEQALLKQLNNATNQYNKHRNDDDASKYQNKLDVAQKNYDGFLKALSDYTSTLGQIEDTESAIQEYKESIQDAADAIIDAIQEGLNNVISSMKEQRSFEKLVKDWNQGGSGYSHFGNQLDYDTGSLQDLLSKKTTNGKTVFKNQTKSLKDRINDANEVFFTDSKKSPEDKKLSEKATLDNLKEATKAVIDSVSEMVSHYDSLITTIGDASTKMDELIDGRLESLDDIEDTLDTRLDQVQLLFGEKSYDQQAQLYEKKVAVNMEKLTSITDAINAKQTTVDELTKLEKNLKQNNKELSTEQRKELEDAKKKVNELQKEQLKTETEILQDIQSQKRATITSEVNSMMNNLFSGGDVEWLSQQWELATRNSEKYLDAYNRAYEIQKLQLKFQDALSQSQNQSAMSQQKINNLANEYLDYLREKNQLSEYDVKHAQLQLEILQKQIALEDARNNKSRMRLQRNAAGNYDFVYAADEEAINKTGQELLALQQEAYNLSKQQYLETYRSAYEAAIQTRDMVVSIAMDASLSTEQQTERIHYVLENLNQYLQDSSVELDEIGVNLYNSFVDASEAIAEINQGTLIDTLTTMQEKVAESAEELIGPDGTLKKIQVGVNTASTTIKDEVIMPTLAKIDERFGLSRNSALGDIVTIEKAVQTASIHITGTTTKSLDDINKLVKFKLLEEEGCIKDSQGNVEALIGESIERIAQKGTKVAGVYEKADKGIRESYEKVMGKDGKGGYLAKFQKATEDALKAAGDNYDDFTENSVKDAEEGLEAVQEDTDKWRSDLDKLKKIIGECAAAIEIWEGKITKAMKAAKTLVDESEDLQQKIGAVSDKTKDAAGGTYALAEMMRSAAQMTGALTAASKSAGSAVKAMGNQISSAYQSVGKAASMATAAFKNMTSAAKAAESAAKKATSAIGAIPSEEVRSTAISGLASGMSDFISNLGSSMNKAFNDWFSGSSTSMAYTDHGTVENGVYIPEWKKKSGSDWYMASGGYTGTWSDKGVPGDDKNGKWAILHKKELVLNAEDTENILSAVDIVRDIMSGLNTLPSLGKNVIKDSTNNTVEQRVEISATFPGVTEAIEIKRALEQLADNAYQVTGTYKY